MVGFLAGGALELTAQGRIGCGERLRAVERLGTDLADVVDTHQGAGATPLDVVEKRAGPAWRRLGSRRLRCAGERPQGMVDDRQQAIGGRELDGRHGASE